MRMVLAAKPMQAQGAALAAAAAGAAAGAPGGTAGSASAGTAAGGRLRIWAALLACLFLA
jgi:hypothetical protein